MNQTKFKHILNDKVKNIAIKAGIHPHSLTNILNGSRSASKKLALKLEKITGIDKIYWLYSEKIKQLLE